MIPDVYNYEFSGSIALFILDMGKDLTLFNYG